MTPEQMVGLLALLADLRNQLAQVTIERDRFAAEVVRLTPPAEQAPA